MPLEWVAPVCTAGVGVVGIAATFWTGRQARMASERAQEAAREAELSARVREEKRAAYTAVLSAMAPFMRAAVEVGDLVAEDRAAEGHARMREFVKVNMERVEELSLVATEDVKAAADMVIAQMLDSFQGILTTGYARSYLPGRVELVTLMKVDLGYELGAVDRLQLLARSEDDLRTEEETP